MIEKQIVDPDSTDQCHVRRALQRASREFCIKIPADEWFEHLDLGAADHRQRKDWLQPSAQAMRWWFRAKRALPARTATSVVTREIKASVKRSRRWGSVSPSEIKSRNASEYSDKVLSSQRDRSGSVRAMRDYHSLLIKVLQQNECSYKHVANQLNKISARRKDSHCQKCDVHSSDWCTNSAGISPTDLDHGRPSIEQCSSTNTDLKSPKTLRARLANSTPASYFQNNREAKLNDETFFKHDFVSQLEARNLKLTRPRELIAQVPLCDDLNSNFDCKELTKRKELIRKTIQAQCPQSSSNGTTNTKHLLTVRLPSIEVPSAPGEQVGMLRKDVKISLRRGRIIASRSLLSDIEPNVGCLAKMTR